MSETRMCPYCGQYPRISDINGHIAEPVGVMIECVNEDCPVQPFVVCDDNWFEKYAIDKWDHRMFSGLAKFSFCREYIEEENAIADMIPF